MAEITCKTAGIAEAISFMLDVPKNCALAEKYTMSDLRQRVPKVVTKTVTNVYNIPEKDIKPTRSLGKFTPRLHLSVSGNSLATLRFVYIGRLLSPSHFDMEPKAASGNPKAGYRITAQILKAGGRKQIGQHYGRPPNIRMYMLNGEERYRSDKTGRNKYYPTSGNILFPTGAKGAGKTSHIPMKRKTMNRKDIEKVATLSVPQMISGERCADDIQEEISGLTEKRLNHQLERLLGM